MPNIQNKMICQISYKELLQDFYPAAYSNYYLLFNIDILFLQFKE